MLRHFRPCRPDACPLGKGEAQGGYPCDVKTWRDRSGVVTDTCVAVIPQPELEAAYAAARAGNTAEIDALTDAVFGGLLGLLRAGISTVQDLGVAVPVLARGEDGQVQTLVPEEGAEPEPVVLRYQQNPAMWSVLELAKLLGVTGIEHLQTPRAQLKAQRKKSDPKSHLKKVAELRERTLGSRRPRRRRRGR